MYGVIFQISHNLEMKMIARFSPAFSRRDFLKTILLAGALSPLTLQRAWAFPNLAQSPTEVPEITYRYRTFSVEHLKEAVDFYEQLKREGKISEQATFRRYISKFTADLPEEMPNARSLIVMATAARMMYVNFHWNDKVYDLIVPPSYFDDGSTMEQMLNIVQTEIIKEPDHQIKNTYKIPLKLLAVRSGLGKYGRNNICFVDGMGTFLVLWAFFTDFQFPEDHWGEIQMVEACENCKICRSLCPTKAIPDENFIINAGNCLSLYNEVPGEFPAWIPAKAHNALMGCIKCQLHCPVNREVVRQAGRFEDISAEETGKILRGEPDPKLLASLSDKLKDFYPGTDAKYFPVFTRNLSALIH